MRLQIALYIYFVSFCCVAEECTFNRSAQLKHTRQVFEKHSGGKFNEKAISITWKNQGAPANFYAYGGCYDLGVLVRKDLKSGLDLKENKIFSIATTMAESFLNENQKATLVSGIANGAFTVEESISGINYYFKSSLYSEYHLEYNKTKNYISINIVENL